MKLSWNNFTLEIHIKEKFQKVLINLRGEIKSGSLSVIMGNAYLEEIFEMLAGRIPDNAIITGELMLNDEIINDSFKDEISIIKQKDCISGHLTVMEHFNFILQMNTKDSFNHNLSDYLDKLELSRFLNVQINKLDESTKLKVQILAGILSGRKILFYINMLENCDSETNNEIVKLLDHVAQNTNLIVLIGIEKPNFAISSLTPGFIFCYKDTMITTGCLPSLKKYFSENQIICPYGMNFLEFLYLIPLDDSRITKETINNLNNIVQNITKIKMDCKYNILSSEFSMFYKFRLAVVRSLILRQLKFLCLSRNLKRLSWTYLITTLLLIFIALYNSISVDEAMKNNPVFQNISLTKEVRSWFISSSNYVYSFIPLLYSNIIFASLFNNWFTFNYLFKNKFAASPNNIFSSRKNKIICHKNFSGEIRNLYYSVAELFTAIFIINFLWNFSLLILPALFCQWFFLSYLFYNIFCFIPISFSINFIYKPFISLPLISLLFVIFDFSKLQSTFLKSFFNIFFILLSIFPTNLFNLCIFYKIFNYAFENFLLNFEIEERSDLLFNFRCFKIIKSVYNTFNLLKINLHVFILIVIIIYCLGFFYLKFIIERKILFQRYKKKI